MMSFGSMGVGIPMEYKGKESDLETWGGIMAWEAEIIGIEEIEWEIEEIGWDIEEIGWEIEEIGLGRGMIKIGA